MKTTICGAAGLAVALIAGCGSNPPGDAPPQGRNDNLIVPGQRIGKVAVGMPAKDLVHAAGRPKDSTRTAKGSMISDFGDGLVAVVSDAELRVVTVGTSDPWYTTVEGIRAGSSELEVQALLGKAQSIYEERGKPSIKTYCYPGLEIDFWPQQRGAAAVRVTSLGCREKP